MTSTTRLIRHPYPRKRGFLPATFAFLYQTPDEQVTHDESVEALLDYACSLEECIAGDFDLPSVITDIQDQVLSKI